MQWDCRVEVEGNLIYTYIRSKLLPPYDGLLASPKRVEV
jgi:hypothetical protein